MNIFISLAIAQSATIYGMGEHNCGEPHKPVACNSMALTASGEVFNPYEIAAAVPAPKNRRIRTTHIWIKDYKGHCIKLKINDKKNWRYIGNGGLDLTPAAVQAITGKMPTWYWSGRLEIC